MYFYLMNALIGAGLAVVIAFIARSNMYVLAGLIPLFPTFTLFAQISAHQAGGNEYLLHVVMFGFVSVITYLIYLLVMYIAIKQGMGFTSSVVLSVTIWAIAAANVFFLAKKFLFST